MANLRDQLAVELGEPVEGPIWDYLEAQGWIDDAELGLMPVRQLASTARRVKAAGPGIARPAPGREPGFPHASEAALARVGALSAIYAAWASARADVARYRGILAKSLPIMARETGMAPPHADQAGLLHPDQAGPWVRWRYSAEAPGRDTSRQVEELLRAVSAHGPQRVADLWFVDGERERILTVAANGGLGQLARLAGSIAEDYRWRLSGATMFVLTGRMPEVQVYVGSAEIHYNEMSAASRVTMTLDPSLSPEDVAGIYASLRQQFHPQPMPRYQPVRRYRLAAHVGPHLQIRSGEPGSRNGPGRPPAPGPLGLALFIEPASGHTWKALRQSWNNACDSVPSGDPGRAWRYSNGPNFVRDSKVAFQQLILPGWTSRR